MFSKEIVGSDAFQDMPASSQLLYFHLGMEADDDGFIGNPKKIARSIGMAEDDMKILVAKRFVLLFPSGVLVIKHHRINNNWDKCNFKRTVYLEEFNQLFIKENKAYTTDKTQGIPVQSEFSLKTVGIQTIDKIRIDKSREDKNRESKPDASIDFLRNVTEEVKEEFATTFKCSKDQVRMVAASLADYCEGHGKKYRNYKAMLRNALRKQFGELSEEEKQKNEELRERVLTLKKRMTV